MRTPIRYAGGKSRAYDFISSYIPFWPRPKRIVSPFFGGGSLEVRWAAELGIPVVGYDVFDILVNYWKHQLENPQRLYDILKGLEPSKEQYEKLIVKTAKKEGKSKNLPSYEDTYNLSLLMLTLVYIVVAIQVSIPSIKTKKTFPGCIKSFIGYPFEGDQDKSSITYIACVASKM